MSLFFVVHNITDSVNLLNSNLSKINKWALKWKMSFNPDPTKQAEDHIHPGLMFNNNIVNFTTIHKHLGMMFDKHLKSVLKKINKTVGLL